MNKDNLLNEIFEYIKNYDSQIGELINFQTPERLREKLDFSILPAGGDDNSLLTDVQNYLKYSVKTNNKQFLNQLYSGENLPAFIGEIITALTNTSMYTYEVAPIATLIEKELINKMCKIAGFKNGGGTFATGGSNANMLAMMSARNKILPLVKQKGLQSAPLLSAFVSDQSHYSFDTAANILGIGSKHVYKIKSDSSGKMIVSDLQNAIENSIKRGETPFFIAATAGTTLLGAFDSLDKIANIAKLYHLWMHVDGSFGGSIILSKKYKFLFKGLENADSFTWNPHKLMNVPLIASVLLLKDKHRLMKNLSDLNTDYIYHDNDLEEYNLGKQSVQCGRRVDALKVWLAWRYYGDLGYEKRINRMFELAAHAEKTVKNNDKLQLLAERQSLNINFIYKSKDRSKDNELNLMIRENLMRKGISMVNYGYLKDKVSIRLVISNPDVSEKDLNEFFNNFIAMGDSIQEKITENTPKAHTEKCLISENYE
ncbi:MAG: pyridoxal-dependent decarboxylase [Bacteroidales bacterium]|nr:pyridoxal-dependent decarboxylase [Bacteroidales bacterium]